MQLVRQSTPCFFFYHTLAGITRSMTQEIDSHCWKRTMTRWVGCEEFCKLIPPTKKPVIGYRSKERAKLVLMRLCWAFGM